jgi:hypothetical protein
MIKIKEGYVIRITLLTTLLFSVYRNNSFSQLTQKRGYIGLKASYGFMDTSSYQNFGITGEYLIKNRIGFIYNMEFQKRSDNFNHIHASVGTLAGPPLLIVGLLSGMSNTDQTSSGSVFGLGYLGALAGLLITILPDGFSYHFPLGYNWDVSPYANVLGIDYVWNKDIGYNQWKYACSFGVKGTYWHYNNWMFQSFLETRKVASTAWGIGFGVGVAYSLGNNQKESN